MSKRSFSSKPLSQQLKQLDRQQRDEFEQKFGFRLITSSKSAKQHKKKENTHEHDE